MSKLRFRVVYFSSEENGFPADELNVHSSTTKGWQSAKFCDYPQELGFELLGGSNIHLGQVQILSHQSKIGSKLEVFIGTGSDYGSAVFKRLGYLSLDSNDRSSFQARELRTVYVDKPGQFVRLIIHRNYVNKLNHFNQVGIIAVNFSGQLLDEARSIEPAAAVAASSSSAASSSGAGDVGRRSPRGDLSVDVNLDAQTVARLRFLADAKCRAVESEDYLMAKQIKLVETELKAMGARLAQLEVDKKNAIRDEDYDLAKDIKDDSDAIRESIEIKIASLQLSENISPPRSVRGQAAQSRRPGAGPSAVPERESLAGRGVGDDGRGPAPRQQQQYSQKTRAGSGSGSSVEDSESELSYQAPPRGRSNPMSIPIPVPAAVNSRGGLSRGGSVGSEVESDAYSSSPVSAPSPRSGRGRGGSGTGSESMPFGDGNSKFSENDPIVAGRGGKNGPRGGALPRVVEADELAGSSSPSMAHMEGQGADHPLWGVPNLKSLPEPEPLEGKAMETADKSGTRGLLGEYRASCLFSKAWVLREAAVIKSQLMLAEVWDRSPGIVACLSTVLEIVRVGMDDKIQQVLHASLGLLDALLSSVTRARIPRSTITPLIDGVMTVLLDKMSDGNVRIRECAKSGIEMFISSQCVGCAVVAGYLLRALPAKQRTAWRPILVRLQLLTECIQRFGFGSSSGLQVDPVMNFVKSNAAFTHSNGEVRDAAKVLTVAVHSLVGSVPIESFLAALRPKQKEEYVAAFSAAAKDGPAGVVSAGGGGGGGGGGHHGGGKHNHVTQDPTGKIQAKSDHPSKQQQQQQQQPSQQKQQNRQVAQDDIGEGEGEFICTFCGAGDQTWDEDTLDSHFLRDCPLLAPCPACAQVLEIAAMPDHLLDECEHKDEFVPCEVTGLAIRADEFDSWKKSSKCAPAPDDMFLCPLCLKCVEDSTEAWKAHLIQYCPENLSRK